MKNHTSNILCEKCTKSPHHLIRLCTAQQLEEVNHTKTCGFYPRGAALFHEGGLPLGIFCINSGGVKLVKRASAAKEMIVRIAKAGDVVGYRSLIMHQRYAASAIASEDSQVCMIPKELFVKISANNSLFYNAVIKMLCEDLGESHNKMAEIAYKPVRGRIAEALVLLGHSSTVPNVISLTREDLASFVGTVKETATRVLAEFRNEHLLKIDKRSIVLLDLESLERLSNMYE